jgi:hypothetical protein
MGVSRIQLILTRLFSPIPIRSGSCIVAIEKGGTLAIAADSISAVEGDDTIPPTSVCKLFVEGNFVCTGAGLLTEPNTGFSAERCFRDAARDAQTLRRLVPRVWKEVRHGLQTFVDGCKVHLPSYHATLQTNPDVIKTDVFLASFGLGRPQLRIVSFRFKDGTIVATETKWRSFVMSITATWSLHFSFNRPSTSRPTPRLTARTAS